MATYRQRQIALLKTMMARFDGDMVKLAGDVMRVVNRYAVGVLPSQRIVPDDARTRNALRIALWREVVKPYFIGQGDEALTGTVPNSPYTRLMVEGIQQATRIEVERQIGIVRKYAGDDPVVWGWLTAGGRRVSELQPKITTRKAYDGFHLFVDPNGYVLSDRVWNTAVDVRSKIDRLLLYHIAQGTAAVDIAPLLEQFLTGEAAKVTTQTPYGVVGSYSARRLARTEITAAAGRAVVNASRANPWVDRIEWRLSPSHPKVDICDSLQGVYPKNSVPLYPPHPHCLCYLIPLTSATPAEVTAALRAEIDAVQNRLGVTDEEARAVRQGILGQFQDVQLLYGVFNAGWMELALMNGDFTTQILGVVG